MELSSEKATGEVILPAPVIRFSGEVDEMRCMCECVQLSVFVCGKVVRDCKYQLEKKQVKQVGKLNYGRLGQKEVKII